jgi:DNA-binding winged helix-turn-helix (wHTH) protein/tetratricopeptide (TPR) repeat protein
MGVPRKQIYVFGDWRLDPAEHLLFHKGTPMPLTPKVFDTLLLLVENAGRLVTKDEFMKRVWPDAFVEDLALVQNISQIRKALDTHPSGGDVSSLIETMPKRGYRFLATVQIISEELASGALREGEIPAEIVVEERPQVAQSQPGKSQRLVNRTLIVSAAAAVIILAILAVASLGWHRGKVLAATDRVLLADFENQTGDPAFDVILKQALRIKLNESPYLNLVPDSEVRQSAEAPGTSNSGAIPRQTALTLCNSLRAKAVVAGQISSPGKNAYRLQLSALRCPDGASLARAETKSASRDEVISALGLAADTLRQRLGEAKESLQQFQAELGRATTNSLPALKAFSLGEEKRTLGQDFESIPFYKMATDLDPDFAMAYARLGIIYANANQDEFAHAYFNKAFDLRDHATARERLYIAAHYYAMTGEESKHVDVYRLWRELYPNDVVPANNLAFVYLRLGQPDKALELALDAIRLSPSQGLVYVTAMDAYHCNGQFDAAKALFDETVRRKLDGFGAHLLRYSIASVEGDQAEMDRQLTWSRGNARESEMLQEAAIYSAATGRLRAAHALFRQAEDLAMKNGLKERAADALLDEAEVEAAYNLPMQARETVDRAIPLLGRSADLQALTALILSQVGDFKKADELAARARENAPLDTSVNEMYLPIARAAAELRRHDPQAAIAQLETVKPYDLSVRLKLSSLYFRGSAELALKHSEEAASQFQQMLAHRGVDQNSPYLPLAHLALARTYLSRGDAVKSRSEYETLLGLWSQADPTLPLKLEAEQEYARNFSSSK